MNLVLLEAELRRDEGVRYSPYVDTTGNRTIGVGHNMDVSPLPASWTFPLSDAQVNVLLSQDISSTIAKLNGSLPWWQQMSDVRMRVLANMCFNMGLSGLLTFKNTLGAMQRGSYAVAAAGMLNSKWASQVGARAMRLASAMEHGVMPVADGIA